MGWKYINGRPYYYRCDREGGRVVTTYLGSLTTGHLYAALDAEDREQRQRDREADQAERRRSDEEAKDLAAWYARVEAVADAAMVAAGYHKHHRSQWRRRRMAGAIQETGSGGGPPYAEWGAVEVLLRRAHAGDAACLPELRKLFRDPRHGPGLIATYGSPPDWLRNQLVESTKGQNLAIGEASGLKLAEVRRELEGPAPSPTERLLAERAAICWWLVYRYESIYAKAEDLSIRQAEYHQRRIDRAHARFLSALKTLATVRKLAVPVLQVNIGANQVNCSSPREL